MTSDTFDGTNESPDDQIKSGINRIIDQYAACDAESQELNDRRADLRKDAEALGFSSPELQEAVRKLKKMTKRQRLAHEANVKLIIDTVDGRQGQLWPEDAERARKREEAKEAQQTSKGPDPDTNPRSDPNAGGAKPMVDASGVDPETVSDEQAEGEAALNAGLPKTKKSQSEISAEKLAAAKLN